ncbi:MAG: GAF domain-containing protein [Microscillaceae bacterium]|nr:GAF domain-containing protein [Microscillaceae bacterium]
MEDQSTEKSSSYKIKFDTIQGRTTLGFLITVLVAVLLIFITDYWWRTLNTQKDTIIYQTKPIAIEAVKLLNLIKVTQTNLSQYLFLEDDSLEKINKEIWLINIAEQKDTLRNRVIALGDTEIKNLFTIINKKLSELKQQQRELERMLSTSQSKQLAKYQVKNDVLFAYQEIDKSFNDLFQEVKRKEKRILSEINEQQSLFYRVLILALILGFVMSYLMGLRLFLAVFRWIREIKDNLKALSSGNIPPHTAIYDNEFKNINLHINKLSELFEDLKNYSITVGEGKFHQESAIFESESELGRALQHMNLSLRKVYDEERKRNWISEGLADFAELLRTESSHIDHLCQKLISQLVKYLDIIQGGIFILIKDEYGQMRFEQKGAYAYGREKFLEKRVEPHEGLIGRVFKEKEIVLLTDIPENYTYITSGLGSASPKSLILLPLLTDEREVIGIIELASLRNFEDFQINFLEKLCTSVTATLTIAQTTLENQKILEEAGRFSDLKVTTEITQKKNLEELNLSREEMIQLLKDLQSRNKKLGSILDGMQEGIIVTNPRGRIEIFSRGAERIFEFKKTEMIGRQISSLIPNEFGIELDSIIQSYSDSPMMDSAQVVNRRNIIAQKKNGTQFPIYLSLSEINIDNQKYFAMIAREI